MSVVSALSNAFFASRSDLNVNSLFSTVAVAGFGSRVSPSPVLVSPCATTVPASSFGFPAAANRAASSFAA